MSKLRWGVMGVSKFAMTKVIPAMRDCVEAEIVAIASRDLGRAEHAAAQAGIPRAFGSYEQMIADPEIDVIYNPLPNHLHLPYSIQAAEAGKAVLCEKPLGLHPGQVEELMNCRNRTGAIIGEAFMVQVHPQWVRAAELVRTGEIGELRNILTAFSYFNRDGANIRNKAEIGGGALYDIGCYAIFTARMLYGAEPLRVSATLERDPHFDTDRLTSALLQFDSGHAVFSCSTQCVPYQRVQVLGTKGRIEVEIPFNAPPDRPTYVSVDGSGDLFGGGVRREEFGVVNQYTLQGDAFSRAVRRREAPPVTLENSLGNARVIEAVFAAARENRWVSL